MNRNVIAALSLVCLALLASTAQAQVEITPPASAVTASTSDGNLPGNTVDNSLLTRWSGNGDGAWLQLDLGTLRTVGSVKVAVYRGNERRNRFDLQLSSGTGVWRTVFSGESSGTTTLEETYDFPDDTARWVRYVGHGSTQTTFNSVTEVSVFEGVVSPTPTPTEEPAVTPTPTATPAVPTPTPTIDIELTPGAAGVTASTHDGNLPANAVDGSLATRWSANGDGQWIQLDLGANLVTVRYVRIAVYNGNSRQNRFDIQLASSVDGPWGTVLTNAVTSGTTTQLEIHDFPDRAARAVRYVGHMSNVGTFNSVTELEVWGSQCLECPPPRVTPTPTSTPIPTPTPTPTTPPIGACTRTIQVATSTQLGSAVANAMAGDCIVLADGSYSGFAISRSGTSTSPILIRAANRGMASITSGVIRYVGCSYVTVEGLRLTGPGGSVNADGSTRKAAVHFEAATRCRLSRCTLRLSGHTGSTEWVLLSGNSRNNRIDHNEMGPNSVDGHMVWPRGNPTISGAPPLDREAWANGNGPFNPNIARDTLIDHNYFHDHMNTVSNGAELIVTGGMGSTGDYQWTNTIIEYNIFENSWGDGELISCKTSGTVIRYNTMRRCGGGPVSRAGNGTQIYGNFILGEGRSNSGGVRIHEMDHQVWGNYIENITGQAIIVGNGDPYDSSSFSHAQVKRAKIVHNTIVGSGGGWTIGNSHPLPPVELVIANNILVNTAFNGPSPMSGWIYSQNISWPASAGRPGFLNVNPMQTTTTPRRLMAGSPAIDAANQSLYPFVVDDMDGQPRGTRDIGADEFSSAQVTRRPLTTADVGPNAP